MTDVFLWTGNDRGRCENCGIVQPLAVLVLADDEHDTGPPTDADFDWYVAHVMVAQDRPPAVNRQAAPYEGQMVIGEGLVVLPSHNVRPDQVPPPAFSPVQTTITDAPIECEIRGCDSLTTTGICASCAMELDADDEDR